MGQLQVNGIWIGDDATIVITPMFRIAFLRINCNEIACVVKENKKGIISVAHGRKTESGFSCDSYVSNRSNHLLLRRHELDKVELTESNLKYTSYDERVYYCTLDEAIVISNNDSYSTACNTALTIPEKLELWSLGTYFVYTEDALIVQINTHKYSVCFRSFIFGDLVYARVGLNGYCEKGYALLPIVCLRDGHDPEGKVTIVKEVQMFKSKQDILKKFNPNLEYFSSDSSVMFPSDGGWYWPIKEITEEYIKLYSCGGDEDIRYKSIDGLSEIFK